MIVTMMVRKRSKSVSRKIRREGERRRPKTSRNWRKEEIRSYG